MFLSSNGPYFRSISPYSCYPGPGSGGMAYADFHYDQRSAMTTPETIFADDEPPPELYEEFLARYPPQRRGGREFEQPGLLLPLEAFDPFQRFPLPCYGGYPVPPGAPAPKCRQLPCRTWISTGTCPYDAKCVFLHDSRVMARPIKLCKRKSQEDVCQDSLFWPTMSRESVSRVLDAKNLPQINQHYVVPNPASVKPPPLTPAAAGAASWDALLLEGHSGSGSSMAAMDGGDPTKDARHVEAVYSMWSHFLDFCFRDENSIVREFRLVAPVDPFSQFNVHTGRLRLRTFQALSQGRPVQAHAQPQLQLPAFTLSIDCGSGGGGYSGRV